MEDAKHGSQEAFTLLYNLYFTPVWRYVYLRTKNRGEADDLAQTIFLKVYKSLPRYRNTDAAPLSYFFTVARNTIIDHWRKKSHGVIYSDEAVNHASDTQADPNDKVKQKEDQEMITKALGTLTEDQEEAIVLRFMSGLSTKEISDVTGKREDAIRQLQSRALKVLRTYFKDNNFMA